MTQPTEIIDVVISFDTTGSMYPCLTQVRRNVTSLVARLFKDIPSIRIGVISHGDYCDGKRAITTYDLTTDKAGLVNFINNVPATNGGDAPECYELVLHQARSFTWKSTSNKVLVLIGDDVPHGPSYHGNTKRLDWRNELQLLLQAGINVYAVQALNRSHATKFYEEVAKTTGGFHLNLDQFSDVNDLIMAVCYKQDGNKLEVFQEELKTSKRMTRSVGHFIAKLMGKATEIEFEGGKKLGVVAHGRFQALEVDRDVPIQQFAEENGLVFKKGRGFYEFIKPVEVQPYKEIILQHKATGDMYTGDKARELAGIPIGGKNVTVKPTAELLRDYTCFIQSTSVNRKLIGGTKFLYEVAD